MEYKMQVTSKYSKIDNGNETLLIVTVPDWEYGEMLRLNPDPDYVRSDILNEAGRVEQKRLDVQAYLDQKLTKQQVSEIESLAKAQANFDKLIEACTDDACGYVDAQMRLAGGHRMSEGMQRAINKIRETVEPATQNEITDSIDCAMTKLGYISETDHEYDVSRNGHKTWKIERVPVSGMDRETVLRKTGKK